MESFLTELFLRGFLLCLLTASSLLLLRRSAAAHRHLVCVSALLILPLLPGMQRLMPALRLLPAQSVPTPQRAMVPFQQGDRLLGLPRKTGLPVSREMPPEPKLWTQSSAPISAGSAPGAQGRLTHPSALYQERSRKATAVLAIIWGLGAATLLLRLMAALLRLRRLEAVSQTAMLGNIPIRVSDQVQTPLTWGLRRSVIVLPTALVSGDSAVCESALRHEQAHIARWDWMWNLLAEIVCALCWFHPAAWWLRGRMRLESERACDDLVLLSGIAGPDYAAHLLEIVRSIGTKEVAPAMAQGGGMEKRMGHILDTNKPRRVSRTWLAFSAPFAMALFSLAALRVSARPAEAKPLAVPDPTMLKSRRSVMSSRRAISAVSAAKPGVTERAEAPQGNGSPAATLDNGAPAISLEKVSWGKAVDGLEPGFLLTTPDLPQSRRVLLNTRLAYKILLRNATARDGAFSFQCSNYGPWSAVPYLIPNADLRNALRSGTLPQRFRALAVSDLAVATPAYTVKLAPGEAVVVPEEFGLYLGDADKQSYPRMEAIQAGKNWIIQPMKIHRLNAVEEVQYESSLKTPYSQKKVATIVDRAGRTGQRPLPLGGVGSGEKQIFPGIPLEIGTKRDWTLTGHTKAVNTAVFSPDSKRLLTGGADGTAIVWDVATGQSSLTLQGRTAPISSALYTPNGKFILTGCVDGTIHLWDATTGEQLRTLVGPGGGVCALDVSSDGATLLGGYENGEVKLWNLSTGQGLVSFFYDNRLLSAALSPDGKNMAAGYFDATVKVWDVATRQSVLARKIPASEGITGMHFDRNNTLYTWDREEGKEGKSKLTVMTAWGIESEKKGQFVILGIIQCPIPESVTSNAVSYDTFTMLSGLLEGQAVLNDPKEGAVTLDAHEGTVTAVALSPDGALGATGGQRNGQGEAKIWEIQAHKPPKQAK